MAKIKQPVPKVTWYVVQVNRDGTEKPAGQFTAEDDPRRALEFARANLKSWIDKGTKLRVSKVRPRN